MRIFRFIILLLILTGAINWGLWGAFQYDIIQDVFGSEQTGWARLIYIIVGLAGIYGISFIFSVGTCGYRCKCQKETKD
jgi:uncharacterized protein